MDGKVQRLGYVGLELRRMKRTLARIARLPAPRGRLQVDAAAVRAILAARRLREEIFGAAIGDVAWALLLDAYAARLEGRGVAMTRLGAAAGVARSTSHRWGARLLERGLFVHHGAGGGRTVSVGLSDDAAARIHDYLAAAIRMSP